MGKKPTEKITDMVTFADIALTLARDFESVFVIDPKDGNYDEYSISGVENELVVRSSGRDFFADMAVNVNESIYEDDRERLLEALEKRKLLKTLKTSGAFLQRYRLMVKGVPRHHSMKVMETAEGFILIAVLDIDRTVRREKELEAEKRTYTEVAESLASLYEVIYHININTGQYTEYSSNSSYSKLGLKKEGKDFFAVIKKSAPKYVSPDDVDRLLDTLDKDNLAKRLGKETHISMTFNQMLDGRMQEVGLIAFRQKSDIERIVVGVVNMNDRTFSGNSGIDYRKLACILAGRYEIIFQVNTETNEYIQYTADDDREVLEVLRTGKEYFSDCIDDINRMIIPEDREMVLKELQRDVFLKDLDRYGKKILTFRHYKGKKTRYMTLFAVRSKEDPSCAAIAIGYADIVKKQVYDLDARVEKADEMSGKDELTNVRNKKSYAFIEAELDSLIASCEKPEFALAVCDIDDLKKINEAKGREAGDESIREACDMICSIFEHSPVFRIGGDEFVAVLRDQDYEKRESLISNLLYEREKSRRNAGVTISYGISDYDPEKDLRV
ncbi:MAG: GGDEF domain-containing protein, partial [Lachnospiraceae bacterium]|nr:GGDEF domain-containing protein [Lachnospiraceae bacterium]